MIPSNNFVENPRKFPGIFPGNSRKFQGIFHRKIWWKWQQLFRGISCNPFRGTMSKEFLVTHFKEVLITLSKEFLVTNSREFLVTNSAEKPEKMSTKFVKIFGNFQRKVLQNQFLGNYSQDFLKSSWGVSWNILSIHLSKFTNRDLGSTVVNNYISLQFFKSLYNHLLSQNVIVAFDLTEVVMYFVYSDN